MNPVKSIVFFLASFFSLNAFAQIHLNGYKCKYYQDETPDVMAEMYCRNDTFLLLFYGRDILCSLEKEDAKMELKMGLEMSFGNNHYFKTRDSLYIYTGKYHDAEIYYYKIYVPEKMVSFSVRSKNNDNVFSKKSKWLLSQIRLNRRRELYLINEKNKLCMDPFGDQE